jgi:hypothetical protein
MNIFLFCINHLALLAAVAVTLVAGGFLLSWEIAFRSDLHNKKNRVRQERFYDYK